MIAQKIDLPTTIAKTRCSTPVLFLLRLRQISRENCTE